MVFCVPKGDEATGTAHRRSNTLAQLVERIPFKNDVEGSIPLSKNKRKPVPLYNESGLILHKVSLNEGHDKSRKALIV